MNNLDRLVAERVMWWHLATDSAGWRHWLSEDKTEWRGLSNWLPSTCADDALRALEHVATGHEWTAMRNPAGVYEVAAYRGMVRCEAVNESLPVALCECALYVAGVSESDIAASMMGEKP